MSPTPLSYADAVKQLPSTAKDMKDIRQEWLEYAKEVLSRDIEGLAQILRKGKPDNLVDVGARALEVAGNATDSPSPLEHDFLLLLAADSLRKGIPIPREVAGYVADVLEGLRSPPARRGRPQGPGLLRDLRLLTACLGLSQRHSLPLFSNNELLKAVTAAEVVSMASGVSLEAVKQAIRRARSFLGDE